MPKNDPKPIKSANSLSGAKPVPWWLIAIALVLVLFVLAAVAVMVAFPSNEGGTSGIPSILPQSGIAIIPLKGEISNESSGGGLGSSASLTANDIVDMIDEAENDSSVGAIFLDIDSPGGEVVASKQIVYRIRESKKPVYSYINSVGASGAYYVASATKYIMADEDSITGSIGVISIGYNLEGLLEKIGVKASVMKVGQYKDMGSPYRDMSADENELLQEILNQAYNNFRANVLEFRKDKLAPATLDSVADGRILTGTQAREKNLVDELLTRQQAIDRAAELSGITDPQIVAYGQKEFSIYDLFFASGKSFGNGFISSISAQNAPPSIR